MVGGTGGISDDTRLYRGPDVARLFLEYRGERREIKISGPVTVGRSKSATVSIDDLMLSREHARIYLDGGRHVVSDLGSKNGTFLNGALLRQPESLKTGDRIKIGPASLTFFLLDSGRTGPMPTQAPSARAHHASAPSTAPVASPARARTRSDSEVTSSQPDPMMVLLINVLLVVTVIVGTVIFKEIFKGILGMFSK